jgi:hypothetical protein
MIIEFIKKRILEIVGVVGNLILISMYLFDMFTIQCEPCIDIHNCPQCQTDFMKRFWIYILVYNLLILIGLNMRKKL